MAYKDADHVSGHIVTAFEKELERAAEVLTMIQCSFNPANKAKTEPVGHSTPLKNMQTESSERRGHARSHQGRIGQADG